MNYSQEEKAKLYDYLIYRYRVLEEEARLIKAESVDVSESNQIKLNRLESEMREIQRKAERLFL